MPKEQKEKWSALIKEDLMQKREKDGMWSNGFNNTDEEGFKSLTDVGLKIYATSMALLTLNTIK